MEQLGQADREHVDRMIISSVVRPRSMARIHALRDLLEAGRYYLRQANQSAGVPRAKLIETAIQSMGLREITPFDPDMRVVEYQAGLVDGALVKMTNREFIDELSTDSPAPGGGSIAALCGVLSVFVVTKRLAFISQGVSHAAFGGVGLALALTTRAADRPRTHASAGHPRIHRCNGPAVQSRRSPPIHFRRHRYRTLHAMTFSHERMRAN